MGLDSQQQLKERMEYCLSRLYVPTFIHLHAQGEGEGSSGSGPSLSITVCKVVEFAPGIYLHPLKI